MSKATLRTKNNTRIALFIKVFVTFEELVIFGTNSKIWDCFFFCFLKHEGPNSPFLFLTRPFPLPSKDFLLHVQHCAILRHTTFQTMTSLSFICYLLTLLHVPKAGLSEICIFLYTLGSLGSKT